MTLAELEIETGLYAEIADLEARLLDAEGRALVYRELAQESAHLLTQARDHALRQGRTILGLRRQIAELLGAEEPDAPEDTWL